MGLVVFGDAQFTAIRKADASPVTLGIEAPRTLTFWLEAEGIAPGLNDVIVATEHKEARVRKEKRTRRHKKGTNCDSQSTGEV